VVEAAVGQGRAEPGAGPLDGTVPERVELAGESLAAEVNSQRHCRADRGEPFKLRALSAS
jgi:hypothetical protein